MMGFTLTVSKGQGIGVNTVFIGDHFVKGMEVRTLF